MEKWSKSLEATINQQAAAAKLTEGRTADFQQKLGQLQGQLADRDQALTAQKQEASRLAGEGRELGERLAQTEAKLKAASSRNSTTRDSDESIKLKVELADLNQKAGQLADTVANLTKVRDELQAKLQVAESGAAEVATLRASLVEAKAQATDLQRDLAVARQQSTGASAGTEDLKRQLAEANQAPG